MVISESIAAAITPYMADKTVVNIRQYLFLYHDAVIYW